MTTPDDLLRLVALDALVERLGDWEQSQVDLVWLRSWVANAEEALLAEVTSGRASEEDAEVVRRAYLSALAVLPGLQVSTSARATGIGNAEEPLSDSQAVVSTHGDLLSGIRPDLHAACLELVRRHLIDDLGLSRSVAEAQIADLLILIGQDEDALGGRILTFANSATSNGIRIVQETTEMDFNVRHAAQLAARELISRN